MPDLQARLQKFGAYHEAPFTNKPNDQQRFLARVVLHRVDGSDDYTELHGEMDDLGFSQYITGSKTSSGSEEEHKLPNGLYYHDSQYVLNPFIKHTLQEAYNSINAIVKDIVAKNSAMYQANKPPTVFVIETDTALWNGLNPAPKS